MEIFFLILPGKIISPNLCQTFEKRPEIIFVIQNPVFYNKFGKSALSIFINHYQKHFSPASLTDSFIFFLYQQELKTIKITNQALYNNISIEFSGFLQIIKFDWPGFYVQRRQCLSGQVNGRLLFFTPNFVSNRNHFRVGMFIANSTMITVNNKLKSDKHL